MDLKKADNLIHLWAGYQQLNFGYFLLFYAIKYVGLKSNKNFNTK